MAKSGKNSISQRVTAHSDNPGLIILPLAALGAGAGAIAGAAIGGLAISTGAIVGGAGGTAVGGLSASDRYNRDYNEAYEECRRSP